MHWHAELTLQLRLQRGDGLWLEQSRYTLRGYSQAQGYARRLPFDAVLQADVAGDRAHLHALLRRDGTELDRAAFRSLAELLAGQGVRWVVAHRHGVRVEMEVARWAAATGDR